MVRCAPACLACSCWCWLQLSTTALSQCCVSTVMSWFSCLRQAVQTISRPESGMELLCRPHRPASWPQQAPCVSSPGRAAHGCSAVKSGPPLTTGCCADASTVFIGIINSISVQPIVSQQRGVMYRYYHVLKLFCEQNLTRKHKMCFPRERAAGTYSILPWLAGMVS